MPTTVHLGCDYGSYTSMPAPLGQGVRVLVVEDDPVQALVLMLFLERLGIDALHVTDGHEAVDAVKSHEFAMVLMDFLMPTVNGVDATRVIRSWEETLGRRRLSIIAVTASAMKEECEGYLQAGMNEVLVKPFSAHELRALVLRHLPLEQRQGAVPSG